jgi:hypothetical protein
VVEHPVFCSVGRQLELVVVRKGGEAGQLGSVGGSIHPSDQQGRGHVGPAHRRCHRHQRLHPSTREVDACEHHVMEQFPLHLGAPPFSFFHLWYPSPPSLAIRCRVSGGGGVFSTKYWYDSPLVNALAAGRRSAAASSSLPTGLFRVIQRLVCFSNQLFLINHT